jgi:hypothetical protein
MAKRKGTTPPPITDASNPEALPEALVPLTINLPPNSIMGSGASMIIEIASSLADLIEKARRTGRDETLETLSRRTPAESKAPTPPDPPVKPRWDGVVLWYGDIELRSYQKRVAPEQAEILVALQKAGWPQHRVGLPESCWPTLHSAIKRINDRIKDRTIQLQSGGDGKSVLWAKSKEV